ncbi:MULTISPECIES: DUF3422 family protein [Citromicrobium]|uniref:DUF3422 family protein n=1 Tax=Citromicrobium TaxID=72173 RepID=UPI0001DD0EEC|nr:MULTISPECIES: DUF3422 domain-containing protein [Citromicrobium]ALG60314.1 hypothetical protein WG74_05190 [Citromicrobium sp. JL477]KPM18984.1 hypothetical protein VO58_02560 [Citromicrobium sp. JL1351]KPM20559.1 hypothetical protein VM77_02365 [Citromicrobium sp. JL31]KPM29972.1 hypothetical protein VO57_02560 [Citromicrobium sp. JL2201]
MAFTEHPLRRELVHEMHLRRFAPVHAPARIVQMVYLIAEDRRGEEQRHLSSLPLKPLSIEQESRHAVLHFSGDLTVLWERHTEATTITLIGPREGQDAMAPLTEWFGAWPGSVLRATRVFVEPGEAEAEALLPEMSFEDADLVSCHVCSGVRVWSDFRIRDDGYGRLLVSAPGRQPDDLGRIVQRLQELGNYRNLALVGLPRVQRLMPELNALEERLAAHAQALVNEAEGGDERLLHDLSQVSAELAQIRAENSYRTSASQAYAQIAADRLDALDVQPIDGYQSLTDFTERRLVPATRTIETFVNRLRRLSERSGDVIALLNTRIDTRIKAQNLELLRSMESSFNLQLRLQNLVEALSVIAASYYAVALIAYMAKGAVGFGEEGHEVDVAIALIAPVVILTIFLLVSRIRHRFIKETENAAARSDKGRPLNDD